MKPFVRARKGVGPINMTTIKEMMRKGGKGEGWNGKCHHFRTDHGHKAALKALDDRGLNKLIEQRARPFERRDIQRCLRKLDVRLIMPDMKVLTTRELNRKTASVLDAVERGETFELRRNGRAVGYITRTPPTPQRRPDWKSHFDWLRNQITKADTDTLAEFEKGRRRQAARERKLGNLR
jgi:antitoxin (DNA-binding transcriptional repressor) of toxin-antitoxin stability system